MPQWRRVTPAGDDSFPGFADVAELARGPLATVYAAREIGSGRAVALKVLHVRDAPPAALTAFERETAALGPLSSHPNIVTLYNSFRIPDGRPVLVLERCVGSLADRLRQRRAAVPVPTAVAIGVAVAGALETAHRAGILHRDLKPENVLITEYGQPALADFGIAVLHTATETTAGLFDFTTLHVAPELLEGQPASPATDVYGLASSLYQLLAGRAAFRAAGTESPASVILRILRDPVPPIAAAPGRLSDLLRRAMSKDPDARPRTAIAFAAELAAVTAAEGWPATPLVVGADGRRDEPGASPVARPQPGAARPRPRRPDRPRPYPPHPAAG